MKRFFITLCALFVTIYATAQQADYRKMSPLVRQLAIGQQAARRAPAAKPDGRELCAFVKIDASEADEVLRKYGCRTLASFGDIRIATIPIRNLPSLSLQPAVHRIEARQGNQIHMDTTTVLLGAARAHRGDALPHAFTGKGVVVGVEDIGFDFTHPNFYSADLSDYRIRRVWDFLSLDTVGSQLYVGAEYTTRQAIIDHGCSRDGLIQTHGTHTLGSAAGSGFNSPYKGMAPGSDICIVANAVGEDAALIDSADVYKFTYATDALGFKYIFDYADAIGKPCVVSFSEGSAMDFRGDDMLYYAIIDSLTGPGHIMVASAGNAGMQISHIVKPKDMEQTSVTLLSGGAAAYFSAKGSTDNYMLRLTMQGPDGQKAERMLTVDAIYACPDSLLTDTLDVGGKPYYITVNCYPSCFDEQQNVMEVVLMTDQRLGLDYYTGIDIVGEGCEVELFRGAGYIVPAVAELGDNAYSIHSPGSAPSVICVGATGYRTGVTNYLGQYQLYDKGSTGERSDYSSVGPTYDLRVKPDVMAPGTNVISSYSSYYLEANPEAGDILSDVEHFEWNGRTYAWNANSGTSMSTPIVAGTIALWLEAKPDLTPDDIIGVIAATARRHDPALTYPNNLYGYGEIDAYAGLLHILGISGIEGLSHHQPSDVRMGWGSDATLSLDFGTEVDVPVTIRVYSTAGTLVKTASAVPTAGKMTCQLAPLPSGVYAIQVCGPSPATTGSFLVRTE